MKKYKIGDKEYTITNELVVGQLLQLANILKDIKLDFSNYISLLASLGEKASLAIAVVLVPVGGTLKDKNLDELAPLIENLPVETFLDMVQDFFFKNKNLGQKFKQVLNALVESPKTN